MKNNRKSYPPSSFVRAKSTSLLTTGRSSFFPNVLCLPSQKCRQKNTHFMCRCLCVCRESQINIYLSGRRPCDSRLKPWSRQLNHRKQLSVIIIIGPECFALCFLRFFHCFFPLLLFFYLCASLFISFWRKWRRQIQSIFHFSIPCVCTKAHMLPIAHWMMTQFKLQLYQSIVRNKKRIRHIESGILFGQA